MKTLLAALLICASATLAEAAAKLDWTDNSTNETVFNIERKPGTCAGAGAWAEIATTPANVKTYTDTTVQEGTDYCYRVAASNSAGKSAFTNAAGAAIPFTMPAAPSGLGVTVVP